MSLLKQLAATIASAVTIEQGNGSAAIEADSQRLDALLGGDSGALGWRLWTNSRCLVTTRRFAALPGFASAARLSAERGWPVFVRPSGGTTVAHRPQMLNVSHFERWRGDGDEGTDRFRIFCEHLVLSLRSAGVTASLGRIDGSHCDGSLNIIADGRKLAGTASLIRRKGDHVGLLSHASIWVAGDIMGDIRAIKRFEAALGFNAAYSVNAHTTLEQISISASESAKI